MDVSAFLELNVAPRIVFEALEARGSQTRFRVAEGDGWRDVTWTEFARQIGDLGNMLLGRGFGAGDHACVFAENSVEWMAAALAVQAVGGVMVPIYASSTVDETAYIIGHCGARVVFCDDYTAARALKACEGAEVEVVVHLAGGTDGTLRYTDARAAGGVHAAQYPTAFEAALHRIPLDAVGLMLYTSGTTGRPKGVPLTHRNVGVNGRDWLLNNAPLIDDDYIDLLWLPMSHVFGFGEACLGNILGFTTYLCDPASVLQTMPEVRPHLFMSVPRYFEKIAQEVGAGEDAAARKQRLTDVTGGRLKLCISGGAGLKVEIKELFWECDLLIIEGYGLTETSPTVTLNSPSDFRFDTVGKPYPSVEVRIANDGEILVKGESVFAGYYKNPEATAQAFTTDGWFKTGDLGRITEDGFLQIVGRKKEIIVTAGGKNISPAPIEAKFADNPHLCHVVLYGDGERFLSAGLWPNPETIAREFDHAPTATELEQFFAPVVEAVNSTLPRQETIKRYRVMDRALTVEEGFLTPTLKIKRNNVYAAFGDAFREIYE